MWDRFSRPISDWQTSNPDTDFGHDFIHVGSHAPRAVRHVTNRAFRPSRLFGAGQLAHRRSPLPNGGTESWWARHFGDGRSQPTTHVLHGGGQRRRLEDNGRWG